MDKKLKIDFFAYQELISFGKENFQQSRTANGIHFLKSKIFKLSEKFFMIIEDDTRNIYFNHRKTDVIIEEFFLYFVEVNKECDIKYYKKRDIKYYNLNNLLEANYLDIKPLLFNLDIFNILSENKK